MQPTSEQLLWMYETMLVIREFEETMVKVYLEGKLPPHIQKGLAFDIGGGPVPKCTWPRARSLWRWEYVRTCVKTIPSSAPTGRTTSRSPRVCRSTRWPPKCLAKLPAWGEARAGTCTCSTQSTKFSCSGIVGASLPPDCGAALAAKKLGTDCVSVAFFGDGAANQGSFHESLNLAALWNLPAIFVCEDNKYAISVEKDESTAIGWNADRAAAYGMPGYRVERNDPLEVFSAAGEAVARARRGGGPSLIEVKTDRYLGHFQGDAEVYRPKGEVAELRAHDPLHALASRLRAQGVLDNLTDSRIRGRSQQRVADAYAFARASAYPAVEEALLHVFVG